MPWKPRHTAGVVVFGVTIGVLGVVATQLDLVRGNHRPNHLGFWAMVVLGVLLLALMGVVGRGVASRIDGVLVDGADNRISLAQFQIAVWTVVVLSAYGAAFYTNLLANEDALQALNVAVPPELWLAMGISSSSLVGSKLILSGQSGRMGHATTANASWGDLFVSNYAEDGMKPDLAKVQMFFFTLILAFGYVAAVSDQLISATSPITELPKLDESFVILLGVSHGGYLTRKAIKGRGSVAPRAASIEPAEPCSATTRR